MGFSVIGDHVDLQRGNTYKSALLNQPGPFLLGLGTIQRDGGFKGNKLKTYSGPSAEKMLVYPGDLYVSLKDVTQSGDLLGSIARVPSHIKVGRMTQDTVKLLFKTDISKSFFYWALRSPQYRAYCRSHATGTTNLGLSRDDFFSFPIPDLDAAKEKIVRLLEDVESKIVLNNEINQTLEEITQAIFKSWFVDFEPTKAKIVAREALLAEMADTSKENNVATTEQIADVERQAAIQAIRGLSGASNIVPTAQLKILADLFPNQLVESELGKIPEGWEVTRFKPIVEKYIDNRGKTPPIIDSGIPLLEVKHLPENSLFPIESTKKYVDEDTYNSWFRAHLEPDDIIISTVGTIGRICLMPENSRLTIAQNLLGMRFNRVKASPIFMYYQMDGFRFRHDVDARLVITVQASIKRKDLETIDLLKPSIEIQNAFERIVKPIAQKQAPLENTTLEKLRDTLLPKLLTGEITLANDQKDLVSA